MEHEEGQFSGAGGAALAYRVWRPGRGTGGAPGTGVGTVVIAHGLGEHSGRYSTVAEGLVRAGYAVWALDHRGHGRSEGTRAYVERFGTYVADLETFRLLARADGGGVPHFLLGHSMGGAIALAHAIERPDSFDGLVLSAPAVDPGRSVPAPLRHVGRLLAKVAPRAKVMAVDPALVSRDPAVVAAYRADPLVYHGKVTARLGAELLARAARFGEEVGGLRAPLLVVHGRADRLVPIEGTEELFERIGSPDKTFRPYDGLAHEVLNEPEGPTVLADIIAWLDAHRAGGPRARP